MCSLRPQDRKSLCRFTFADGRQCRTPRAADKLARDLSYFFSGQSFPPAISAPPSADSQTNHQHIR